MTKDEFKPIAKMMRLAYQRDNFLADSDTLDLWLDALSKYDSRVVKKAVKNHISKSTFQPTIADIISEYNNIMDEYGSVKRELREIYDDTRGRYPEAKDTEKVWTLWCAIIYRAKTLSGRIEIANKLKNKVWRYVENAERIGKIDDVPSFEYYLEIVNDELRG